MTQFSANGEPRFAVDRALLGGKRLRARATCRGCFPSGQFEITCLRIRMPMAVHPMDARALALMLEPTQLLDVLFVGRNETAAAGESLRFVEQLPLLVGANRDRARASALAPGRLERQVIPAICPGGLELDGLCAT